MSIQLQVVCTTSSFCEVLSESKISLRGFRTGTWVFEENAYNVTTLVGKRQGAIINYALIILTHSLYMYANTHAYM